jgi:hypothetical protein
MAAINRLQVLFFMMTFVWSCIISCHIYTAAVEYFLINELVLIICYLMGWHPSEVGYSDDGHLGCGAAVNVCFFPVLISTYTVTLHCRKCCDFLAGNGSFSSTSWPFFVRWIIYTCYCQVWIGDDEYVFFYSILRFEFDFEVWYMFDWFVWVHQSYCET